MPYDFEIEAALAYRLPCVKIVDLFRNASLRSRTHDLTRNGLDTLPWYCHGLSESNGIFPVPIGPAVPAREDRNNEINIHVPLTRMKEAQPSLPQLHLPTCSGYRPTKFEKNPSIVLACSHVNIFFARVCAIARGTFHVHPIVLKPIASSFQCSG